MLKLTSHSISEGLILNFWAMWNVLNLLDLKYCDVLLKLLSILFSVGLILKNFQGQAFIAHISPKIRKIKSAH